MITKVCMDCGLNIGFMVWLRDQQPSLFFSGKSGLTFEGWKELG